MLHCIARITDMRLELPLVAAVLSIIGLLAVAGGEDFNPAGEKIPLKLNLVQGDTKRLALDADTNIHWRLNDQPTELHLKGSVACDIDVQHIDAGGDFTVQTTETRFAYSLKGGSFNTTFDSDHPTDQAKTNSHDQPARQFIGQPIRLKLDSLGQPTEVVDIDQLIEDQKTRTPSIAPEWTKQYTTAVMSGLKLVMAPLPNKPVAIGDKWQQQRTSDLVATETTYTLHDYHGGVAYVDLDGTMNVDPGDLKGPIHGQLEINQRTGWLIKEVIDLKLISGEILKVDGALTVTGK
jgi:hypothetical protein